MRSGNHHCHINAQTVDQRRHRRCRNNPEPHHVNTFGGKACRQRRLQHIARNPGIFGDSDFPLPCTNQLCRRIPEFKRKVRHHRKFIGHASDAVCSEPFVFCHSFYSLYRFYFMSVYPARQQIPSKICRLSAARGSGFSINKYFLLTLATASVIKFSEINADLAQLVELLICNQWVGGSSPSVGTIRKQRLCGKLQGLIFCRSAVLFLHSAF